MSSSASRCVKSDTYDAPSITTWLIKLRLSSDNLQKEEFVSIEERFRDALDTRKSCVATECKLRIGVACQELDTVAGALSPSQSVSRLLPDKERAAGIVWCGSLADRKRRRDAGNYAALSAWNDPV